MAVTLETTHTSGATVFFTAVRLSDGNTWDETNTVWAASPAAVDARIAATEGTGNQLGYYSASVTEWTTEGDVDVFVHEDDGGTISTLGKETIVVTSGSEVSDRDTIEDILADTDELQQGGPSGAATVSVANARTWFLRGDGDDITADQIVSITTGDAPTLAMDFAEVLNPTTAIVAVQSVVENGSQAITITDREPSQNRTRAHFKVSGQSTGITYTFRVVVTTTDGDQISGLGVMKVE